MIDTTLPLDPDAWRITEGRPHRPRRSQRLARMMRLVITTFLGVATFDARKRLGTPWARQTPIRAA